MLTARPLRRMGGVLVSIEDRDRVEALSLLPRRPPAAVP
jgi:hypothetical protein